MARTKKSNRRKGSWGQLPVGTDNAAVFAAKQSATTKATTAVTKPKAGGGVKPIKRATSHRGEAALPAKVWWNPKGGGTRPSYAG